MSDIVERLRADAIIHLEVANSCDCKPEDTQNWQHHINNLEAADEIERLRAELSRVGDLYDKADKEAAAEVERLRAELAAKA